ncbi:hypothetical protein G6F57_017327 [Rhizopus arrhizus]|nr:hypothetical protein G6F57_017327 [Rhizopus arrhizus]
MGVERQRRGLVQHGDGGGDHFHLAGAHLVIHCMAGTHHAFHLQHVLVAQRRSHGEHFGVVHLHRHLHDAFMISKIDEADAALVTGHVGPAGEGDSLANQGLVDQAAEVGTHGGKLRWRTPAPDGGRKASYSAAEAPAGANPASHTGLIAPLPIVGHLPPYGMPP